MVWRFYKQTLHAHPFKTKALTSALVTGLADVGLQIYERNSNTVVHEMPKQPRSLRAANGQVDAQDGCWSWTSCIDSEALDLRWSRTLTLAAVGLLYSGPINHLWFAALERLVWARTQTLSIVMKLVLDQIVYAPIAVSGYMTVRSILERKSELQIREQLEEKVVPALMACWQFWPLVNLVSFSMVPVIYRVLFGNVCAIFWNAKLSLISSETTGKAVAPCSSEVTTADRLRIRLAIENVSPLAASARIDRVFKETFEDLACKCNKTFRHQL